MFREKLRGLSAISQYMGTGLNMTPQHQNRTAGRLRRQSAQLHLQFEDRGHKSPWGELPNSAVEPNGCSEIRDHGCINNRHENHAQTRTPTPSPLKLNLGQTKYTESSPSPTTLSSSIAKHSSTKASKYPSSTSNSSFASQTTKNNTALDLQAAPQDFAPLLCEIEDTSTAVLSAPATATEPATQSNISNSCDHTSSTPATKLSDPSYNIDNLQSATISFSDTNLPCSNVPGPTSPIDSTAETVSTSGATTSGSDSCPQKIPSDFVLPSPIVKKNIPTSVQIAGNLTATSNDRGHISSIHCKKIANDCFVELAVPLPIELEHEWDHKICNPLSDAICRSVDAEVTIECVMARLTSNGRVMPTVLLMCAMPKHKSQIEKILRGCKYIPKSFRRKVAVLNNHRCTLGLTPKSRDESQRLDSRIHRAQESFSSGPLALSQSASTDHYANTSLQNASVGSRTYFNDASYNLRPIHEQNNFIRNQTHDSKPISPGFHKDVPNHIRQNRTVLDDQTSHSGAVSPKSHVVGEQDTILAKTAMNEMGSKSVIFGNLARFYSVKDTNYTVSSTIGGVIQISGIFYGLTTAHGIQTAGNWRLASEISSDMPFSGMQVEGPLIFFTFTYMLKISQRSGMLNTQNGPLTIKANEPTRI